MRATNRVFSSRASRLVLLLGLFLAAAPTRAQNPAAPIVSAVLFQGSQAAEPLADRLGTRAGAVLSPEQLDADVRTLMATGYFESAGVTRSPDGPQRVKVVFELRDRPGLSPPQVRGQCPAPDPLRVGQIFVLGNTRTRQDVILRQMAGILPGQVLSLPDLRQAQLNLQRLGIFKNDETVHPTVEVVESPSNLGSNFRDIKVQVQEDTTASLMFGLNANSDAGLTGSIVYNERNFDITRIPTSFDDLLSGNAFRGGGEELRLEALPGTQVQRYVATFREPYLFDIPLSLATSGYYFQRTYNEYTEERPGTRLTLNYPVNRLWNVSGAFRAEDVGVSNVSPLAPSDYRSVVGYHSLFGLRGGFTRDARDNYLRPTSGSLIDVSFEEVTGAYTFPLLNAEANQYFTVAQRVDGSGKHVLNLRSVFGLAGANTPVYERFFAGGIRTLRGFQFRGVGPDINGFKVGGDFLFLNSAEYQIPLLANDRLYLVGFVDSGTVSPRITDFQQYRVSVGTGLRILIPQFGPVPIALDVAFPVHQAPYDNTQIFNFYLGFFR